MSPFLEERRTTYVQIEKITLDPDSVLQFKVMNSSGDEIKSYREFLRDPKSPDIGRIPISASAKQKAAADIPDKVLKEISKYN